MVLGWPLGLHRQTEAWRFLCAAHKDRIQMSVVSASSVSSADAMWVEGQPDTGRDPLPRRSGVPIGGVIGKASATRRRGRVCFSHELADREPANRDDCPSRGLRKSCRPEAACCILKDSVVGPEANRGFFECSGCLFSSPHRESETKPRETGERQYGRGTGQGELLPGSNHRGIARSA